MTASSERQAELYRDEIQRRSLSGMLPRNASFWWFPTLTIAGWAVAERRSMHWECWARTWRGGDSHRALLIHSGGDSRRLPQYSPVGKLFGVLPSRTRPRGTTTVFDETMTLSAAWAEGIQVASWWPRAMWFCGSTRARWNGIGRV